MGPAWEGLPQGNRLPTELTILQLRGCIAKIRSLRRTPITTVAAE